MAFNSIVDYCNYTTRNGEQSLGIFNSQKCTVFEIQAFKVEKVNKNLGKQEFNFISNIVHSNNMILYK